MTSNNSLLWVLVGTATALIYLTSQQWSVNRLTPQRTRRSMVLIVGGAVLRWLLIAAALIFSMSYSYKALLLVFLSFMMMRFLFLLKWQGWLRIKNPFIRQS